MSCLRVCQRQRKYYPNEWSDDSSDEDIYNILTCNEDTPPGKKVSRTQSFTPRTSTGKFRRTPTLKKASTSRPSLKRCDSFDSFDSDCMYRIADTPKVLPLESHYSSGYYGSPDRHTATVKRASSFNTAPCRNISPIYNKLTRLPIPDSSVEVHSTCSSESSTDSAFVDYDPCLRRHSSFNSHHSAKPVLFPSVKKLSPASSTSSMSEATVFQKVSSSSYAPSSTSSTSWRKQRPATAILVFPSVS